MVLGTLWKQALFTITLDNVGTEQNEVIFLPNKPYKKDSQS